MQTVTDPGPTSSESSLFMRYRRSDDLHARRELIERHLPLARRLARRYARARDVEDLVQVASLALVKAVDRYDPARGCSFTSFAVPTIVGELKRYFRDCGWALHVPRDLQERAQAVEREVGRQAARHSHAPTTGQLADALGLDSEEVLEAQAALTGRDATSLDAPVRGTDAGVSEHVGRADRHYELIENCSAAAPAVRRLPERDRVALRLRFVDDMTQREIGLHLGISQMQVSRVLRRALEQIREEAVA